MTDSPAAANGNTSPTEGGTSKRRRKTPGLSTQVLTGLVLGVMAGIIFGEWMARLQIVGDVFVGLLQMTVIPYIVVSLVLSLGRLSYAEVGLLARKGGTFILLFWILAVLIILGMVMGFPDWPSATFFSTSMIEQREAFDLVELYVPSNPFFSLTNGVIPAIVLTAIAGGLALSGVPEKEYLLKNFDMASDAIMRIAQFVVRLAPLGVFALVASTAGTMSIEEFGRLEVYLLTYIGAALLLSLWILPGLVSVLTPIPFKRVVMGTQDALITAFATYNLLIVLPLLSERIKEMLQEVEMLNEDTESAADLIVPINFNLPNLGKLLALGFIPFAGWFSGAPIAADQYPEFLVSGLFSFFGEVVVALPFLLDLMRIPADTFQVFLAIDQFSGRFGTLLAGMHTVVLGLLTAAAVSGCLRVNWVRLGRHLAISLVLGVAIFGGLRMFFEKVVPQEYRQWQALAKIDLVTQRPVTRYFQLNEIEPLAGDDQRSRVEFIKQRGTLRVGHVPASLPFVYDPGNGEIKGMELDMVQLIAGALDVELDLVVVTPDEIPAALDSGKIDIAIGGMLGTPDRALSFHLSEPYMSASLSFVTRDHRRREFASWERIEKMDDLHLALVQQPYFEARAEEVFPYALVEVLESPRDFFTAAEGTYDALVYSAEAGSAWTLLYPQFSVVIPEPDVISVPVVFGLPNDEPRFNGFVDAWIRANKASGRIDRLYQYWILGRGAKPKEKRWSVVHNIFGWGKPEARRHSEPEPTGD